MTATLEPTWLTQATCRNRPDNGDLWFSDTHHDRALAMHLCRNHCPVLKQCAAAKLAPAHGVFHGVAYNAKGRRDNTHQLPDNTNCNTCREAHPTPTQPTTTWDNCGTYQAYQQHLLANQEPCRPCKSAAAARDRDRKRRERERAAAGKNPSPCGTLSGVRKHKTRGEERCDLCAAYQQTAAARANAALQARATISNQELADKVRDLVGRYSDPQIAGILGIGKRTVCRIRDRYDIPSHRQLLSGRYTGPGRVAA